MMIKGLPEKLKELRLQYNYSQKSVADKLNISTSIISGYETGERTPSCDNLLSLARLYHCSTDYLLGNNFEQRTITIDVTELSPEQIQALTILVESLKKA
jgi:transcriptional regulator with XRE-family HTH domain